MNECKHDLIRKVKNGQRNLIVDSFDALSFMEGTALSDKHDYGFTIKCYYEAIWWEKNKNKE